MAQDNRRIRDAIQKIAKQGKRDFLISIPAKVTAVNNNLCDVEPVSGDAEIFDVRLQPGDIDGIYIEPKINSIVYITQLDENNYFVTMYSEIVSIKLGDGSNGGLTITPELKTQLEKSNNLITALIGIINGPPIPEPGLGAPSAFQTALKGAIAGKSLGTFEKIENETITHGNL